VSTYPSFYGLSLALVLTAFLGDLQEAEFFTIWCFEWHCSIVSKPL